MNVYEKLNECRQKFQSANVKKSGHNSYAGYDYYELADIIPQIIRICQEVKATYTIKFDKELCYLEFIDCEKPTDIILFTSPMASATLKGCHEVQNLGASETYLTRYLLQTCFAIVENDALDATMQPASNEPKIEELIKTVKARYNTYNEKQKSFADKAIKERNLNNLELIKNSKK